MTRFSNGGFRETRRSGRITTYQTSTSNYRCVCPARRHFSLNDTTLVDDGYLAYLKEKGIGLINASPISMGLLTSRGPPDWHPAHDYIKDACREANDYCLSKEIDISKLAMHFTLANEDIPTTLVSTASLRRAKSNIAAINEELTPEEAECSAHIRTEIFEKKLKGRETWDGVELAQYWEALGKAHVVKSLYGEKYLSESKLSSN